MEGTAAAATKIGVRRKVGGRRGGFEEDNRLAGRQKVASKIQARSAM